MLRRPFFILSVASLLCCIATAVCWARSYWQSEVFMVNWARHDYPGSGEFSGYTQSRIGALASCLGHIGVETFYCDWYRAGVAHKTIARGHFAFFHLDGPRQSKWGGVPNFTLEMSYAIPTTTFALLPAITLLRSRLKKRCRAGFAVLPKSAINSPA
jgi:hypothetical protein